MTVVDGLDEPEAIEENADLVALLAKQSENSDMVELLVTKHRCGAREEIRLEFIADQARF